MIAAVILGAAATAAIMWSGCGRYHNHRSGCHLYRPGAVVTALIMGAVAADIIIGAFYTPRILIGAVVTAGIVIGAVWTDRIVIGAVVTARIIIGSVFTAVLPPL